ncbi:MAG: stage III sporulation protein AE [Lachnospiraceae bacterium]|nr:stage III sporulation protein AE [Lachnospiraceae bacterium]
MKLSLCGVAFLLITGFNGYNPFYINSEYYVNEKAAEADTTETDDYSKYDTYDNKESMSSHTIDYEMEAFENVYDRFELDNLDRELKKNGISLSFSVKDMIKDISKGNSKGMVVKFRTIIKNALIGQISDNKNLMVMLITVVLIGSTFVNLSVSMGNGFISDNGFYITYLIITAILLTSFMITLDMVENSINLLLTMIKIIIPFFAVAINFIGHASSSVSMYEIIMIGIWLVESVILNIILPMIRFFVIVTLVNNLSKEDYFSRLTKLINSLVNWILKSVVFFIAGLNIIKSLIEPHIDMLGKSAVNKLMSAMPSGTMISVLTGTFLGAGIVIKNSIGIAGIILIGLIICTPVIKTVFVMLVIRITAVILQPIGEKRYIEGLEGLAQGIKLLLLCIFSSVTLFVLTIAIMAYATNSGGILS